MIFIKFISKAAHTTCQIFRIFTTALFPNYLKPFWWIITQGSTVSYYMIGFPPADSNQEAGNRAIVADFFVERISYTGILLNALICQLMIELFCYVLFLKITSGSTTYDKRYCIFSSRCAKKMFRLWKNDLQKRR